MKFAKLWKLRMQKFVFWLKIAMRVYILIKDNYKKIVKALCKENNVPLVTIKQGASLGEYIGICKYDSQNNVRKPRKCSSVVLREFPADVSEEEVKAFMTLVTGK